MNQYSQVLLEVLKAQAVQVHQEILEDLSIPKHRVVQKVQDHREIQVIHRTQVIRYFLSYQGGLSIQVLQVNLSIQENQLLLGVQDHLNVMKC